MLVAWLCFPRFIQKRLSSLPQGLHFDGEVESFPSAIRGQRGQAGSLRQSEAGPVAKRKPKGFCTGAQRARSLGEILIEGHDLQAVARKSRPDESKACPTLNKLCDDF